MKFNLYIVVFGTMLEFIAATNPFPTGQPTRQPIGQPTSQPSRQPIKKPTSRPSREPTTQPSRQPSRQPTRQPSVPTGQPTRDPSSQPSSNPTAVANTTYASNFVGYKARNRFAFAVITATGGVVTWGDPQRGGSTACQKSNNATSTLPIRRSVASLLTNIVSIVGNSNGFAALRSDGLVVPWGAYLTEQPVKKGGTCPSLMKYGDSACINSMTGVKSIVANDEAFAALTTSNAVIPFGPTSFGGSFQSLSTATISLLQSGVQAVYANGKAFAAVRSDGTVVCWGSSKAGGGTSTSTLPALVNPTAIYSNKMAFAAVVGGSGLMLTWGSTTYGGQAQYRQYVRRVYSNAGAFVALTQSRTLRGFGSAYSGAVVPTTATPIGQSSPMTISDVVHVAATTAAFAALTESGLVFQWGRFFYLDPSHVPLQPALANVAMVYSNTGAFAAVSAAGQVWSWGEPECGGDGSMSSAVQAQLQAGVKTIYSTTQAFAALKANGDVVTWGHVVHGGDSSNPFQINKASRRLANELPLFEAAGEQQERETEEEEEEEREGEEGQERLNGQDDFRRELQAVSLQGIASVCANDVAFVAVTSNGIGYSWGSAQFGGALPAAVTTATIRCS